MIRLASPLHCRRTTMPPRMAHTSSTINPRFLSLSPSHSPRPPPPPPSPRASFRRCWSPVVADSLFLPRVRSFHTGERATYANEKTPSSTLMTMMTTLIHWETHTLIAGDTFAIDYPSHSFNTGSIDCLLFDVWFLEEIQVCDHLKKGLLCWCWCYHWS